MSSTGMFVCHNNNKPASVNTGYSFYSPIPKAVQFIQNTRDSNAFSFILIVTTDAGFARIEPEKVLVFVEKRRIFMLLYWILCLGTRRVA